MAVKTFSIFKLERGYETAQVDEMQCGWRALSSSNLSG